MKAETVLNRMGFRHTAAVIFVLLVSATTAARDRVMPGHAVQPPRIVVVSLARCCPAHYWPEAEDALIEELHTLFGATHAVFPQTIELSDALFLSLQRRYRATVVLSISRTGRDNLRADILSSDNQGQVDFRPMTFPIHVGNGTENETVSLVSLRVIEAVRARMLSITPSTPIDTDVPVDVPVNDTTTDDTTRKLFARGGVVWSGGSKQIAPCVGPTVGFGIRPTRQSLFDVNATLYARCPRISNGDHDASFIPLLVKGGMHRVFHAHNRIHFSIGIEGGLAQVWSRGHSDTVNANKTDRDTVIWAGGGFRAGVDLNRTTGIVITGTAGTTFPTVQIFFNDESVARWGRPLLEGGISLDIRFPRVSH